MNTETYKEKLETKRQQLMSEIEKDSTPNNPGNDVVLPGEEEADETEEFVNNLAIAETLRKEVQEIDSALERIRNGTYGKCTSCGNEIEVAVLEVAPESALCEQCKVGQ